MINEDWEREHLKDQIYLLEEAYLIEEDIKRSKVLGSSKDSFKFVNKEEKSYATRTKLSRIIKKSRRQRSDLPF